MGGLGVPVLWEGGAGFDRSCSRAVVSFPGDFRAFCAGIALLKKAPYLGAFRPGPNGVNGG